MQRVLKGNQKQRDITGGRGKGGPERIIHPPGQVTGCHVLHNAPPPAMYHTVAIRMLFFSTVLTDWLP